MTESAPLIENVEQERKYSAEELVRKFKLLAGERILLQKRKIDGEEESEVPIGKRVGGVLLSDVKVGEQIHFLSDIGDNGNTTSVHDIVWKNGKVYIGTRTSIYELIPGVNREGKEYNVDQIAEVVTARGSNYRYLPNGTTQRYKKVENKECAPQDILVYVPDFEYVRAKKWYKIVARCGDDAMMYNQMILEAVQGAGKTYVVDAGSNPPRVLTNNAEVQAAKLPNLICIYDNPDWPQFAIPVSAKPLMGFMTYDERHTPTGNPGETESERHLGNAVVEIILKSEDPAEV